jgi:Flp pilus assembly protein TadG
VVHMKERPPARRGLALVEAALVMPLLFFLLLGCVQYGWCFIKVQQLEQAARQGARIGALQTATTAKVTNSIASIMNAAGMSQGSSGYVVTLKNATTGATITNVADIGQLPVHHLLEVTVTIPDYTLIGIINAPLIPMPASLTRRTAMLKEGPL